MNNIPWLPILTRGIILLSMMAIVFSLGSAVYLMMQGPKASQRFAFSLSVRIGMSIVLFLFLWVAYFLGWIKPHGLMVN